MRIITDSAADFTPAELEANRITCVPTQVIFNQECRTPGVDISTEEFWQRLLSGESAKTSQPSPNTFLQSFIAAKESGEEAVCICVSSGVSGTIQSARLAAAMCEWDGIHVVDSLTGAAGQKLLVLHACRLRDEGRTAHEIVQALEKLRGRVKLFAGVDTLEFLARSGRIPKALASLGTLTKLKPLLEVKEGRIALGGKAFGRHRAIEALAGRIAQCKIDPAHPILPLYSFDQTNCLSLLRKLKALGVHQVQELCPIGASIGPHIGPGAYGAAFVTLEE